MGWSSGSSLMTDIIQPIKRIIKDGRVREKLYVELIMSFEAHDADTLDECLCEDSAYDNAWVTVHPPDEED